MTKKEIASFETGFVATISLTYFYKRTVTVLRVDFSINTRLCSSHFFSTNHFSFSTLNQLQFLSTCTSNQSSLLHRFSTQSQLLLVSPPVNLNSHKRYKISISNFILIQLVTVSVGAQASTMTPTQYMAWATYNQIQANQQLVVDNIRVSEYAAVNNIMHANQIKFNAITDARDGRTVSNFLICKNWDRN